MVHLLLFKAIHPILFLEMESGLQLPSPSHKSATVPNLIVDTAD